MTIAEASEVEVIGPMIVRLLAGIPGLRVLATVRGDFLTRVVTVPGLGDEVSRGIFLLRPLSPEGAREAIVGPAKVNGVRFESEELIDELVEAGVKGSLPLLQFALAELWESRDKSASVITEAELRTIGGVTGALARHADGVLASLLPVQRQAARRLLMRLVTLDNTRASLTEDELVANDEASKAALDALVRGRLLVVREAGERMVYEIAHEALVGGWAQLAGWLIDEQEVRAVMHRLEQAAAEWVRLGERREGLWSLSQLAESASVDRGALHERELAFLERSQASAQRSRALRRGAIIMAPLLLSLLYLGMRVQSAQATDRQVDTHIRDARELIARAVVEQEQTERHRSDAIRYFDDGEVDAGNQLWEEMLKHSQASAALYAQAAQSLEAGRSIDVEREDLQEELAAVLYERVLIAETLGQTGIRDELLARLSLYDHDGLFTEKWREPASLEVVSSPPGARVVVSSYESDDEGRLREGPGIEFGTTPISQAKLEVGSHLLTLALEGGEEVRYPLLVRRGETLRVHVEIPAPGSVPPEYVYIPEGRSMFGARGDEDLRRAFYGTVPAHDVWTKSFLISREETTFADYFEYLATLSPADVELRRPRADGTGLDGGFNVVRDDDGVWRIHWQRGDTVVEARAGELFRYPGRAQRSEADWQYWPVSGLSFDDARAYASWLSANGKVAGARLCTEIEWERAALGAGDRSYPHGNSLGPSEANFELSYDRNPLGMGPDPVGSYPESRSPFGVDDLVGNVFEWVSSSLEEDAYVVRGGAFFYDRLTCRSANRVALDRGFRSATLGVRVCATYTHRP